MADLPEVKSLRWLSTQFPFVNSSKDDCDRLSNAIHAYSSAGADCILRLQDEVECLRLRLKEVSRDG